ncbi:MAG TPA: protein kinase [Blastocatellia bacterium]
MISSNQQFSPAPGGKIKGRYLIERELGRGGVGVVFLARDERLHGMPVVIKFLLDAAEQNKWLTGKFSQEAEALTRINHPGVVRVIDRDNSEDGRPFFVMEFIKGLSLREFISQGPMDLAYVAQFARQAGSALHAAHQQGVFHRDLKPENVMLEQLSGGDQQVKLIDFGIAKVINPQAGNETEVAIVAGSRQYIAPEQLLSQTASPATDIYALAIIVYEMVTGRLPFNPQGATHFLVMQELMRLQRSESVVKPRAFRPDLPEAAQILILNALSFDAARRPQNARIFTEDLAQALLGKISADEARATVVVPAPGQSKAPGPPAAPEPPNTEIYPVENTAAQARATDANAAAQTSAPKLTGTVSARVTTAQDTIAKPGGRKFPVIPILIIAIIAATAVIAVKTLWPSVWPGSTAEVTQSPTPRAASPAPAAPGTELTFNYWFTVRKNPKLYGNSSPLQVPEEAPVAVGDQIHFSFSSPQTGHLYIINESPAITGQASSFNILFPSPTSNGGVSQVPASQIIRIPDHNKGFVIDEEQGEEKLWLIWSAREVAGLEPLTHWANPDDAGEIKDATQVKTLREFLAAGAAKQPPFTKNDKQTTVKMQGDILVKLVTLRHY